MTEFDGTMPVDEQLNMQAPIREKEDAAQNKIKASARKMHISTSDKEYAESAAELRAGNAERDLADHQARQNIRKKLGIPETPGVDSPHKYDAVEEFEDPENEEEEELEEEV